MKSLIVGKKKISYVNKVGKQVDGYKIFCNSFSNAVSGMVSGSYYIPLSNKELYAAVDYLTFDDGTYDIVDLDFSIDMDSGNAVLNSIRYIESRKWDE